MSTKIKLSISLSLLSLIILSCGSILIKSSWADDIEKENWRRNLTFFEDEKISISAINNQNELKFSICRSAKSISGDTTRGYILDIKECFE